MTKNEKTWLVSLEYYFPILKASLSIDHDPLYLLITHEASAFSIEFVPS